MLNYRLEFHSFVVWLTIILQNNIFKHPKASLCDSELLLSLKYHHEFHLLESQDVCTQTRDSVLSAYLSLIVPELCIWLRPILLTTFPSSRFPEPCRWELVFHLDCQCMVYLSKTGLHLAGTPMSFSGLFQRTHDFPVPGGTQNHDNQHLVWSQELSVRSWEDWS